MAGLAIEKLSYSSNPWRITLGGETLCINEILFCFQRKRDAKPFFEALLAIGAWSEFPNDFTDEQRKAVWGVLQTTPDYLARKARAEVERRYQHELEQIRRSGEISSVLQRARNNAKIPTCYKLETLPDDASGEEQQEGYRTLLRSMLSGLDDSPRKEAMVKEITDAGY